MISRTGYVGVELFRGIEHPSLQLLPGGLAVGPGAGVQLFPVGVGGCEHLAGPLGQAH